MNSKKKTTGKQIQGQQSISSFFTRKDVCKSKLSLKRSVKSDENLDTNNTIKRKQDEELKNGSSKKVKTVLEDQVDKMCDLASAVDVKIHEKSPKKQHSEGFDDFFSDDWSDLNLIQEVEDLDLNVWQKCEVVTVENISHFTIKLGLKSSEDKKKGNCIVSGVWLECQIAPGDILSLIAYKKIGSSEFQIDNTKGMLIHWPDTLVSGTAVVGSLFCKRKAILSDRFKGIDAGNKHLVIGRLVHELFQYCLRNRISEIEDVRAKCKELMKDSDTIYMIYESNVDEKEIFTDIMKFIPQISHFAKKYVKNGSQNIENKESVSENKEWDGVIDRIVDIEENIWSPRLGLKGKIDVSVEVTIHNRRSNDLVKKYMPLELKTGRQSASPEHKGQVILYTMLMTAISEDFFNNEVKEGLLLYLKESIGIHQISSGHSEKRDLLMLRNQLVHFIVANRDKKRLLNIENNFSSTELPEPINHHNACGKCPYLTLCSTFLSKDAKISLSEDHPLSKLQSQAIGHLSDAHFEYFFHWCHLLALEESERQEINRLKDVWTLPPEKREKYGKALINMTIVGKVVQYGNQYEHNFKRHSEANTEKKITESLLQLGEAVIVSTGKKIAVSTGVITGINSGIITLLLERDLTERNKLNAIFNLDLYESQSLISHNLTNLGLMLDDTELGKKMRSLIIEKQTVTFNEKLHKEVAAKSANILKGLNKVQVRAVLKALTANDYILIKGMPGTGKTQTIAALIELLVELGKTVIVTSQTHSAVDNVLLRLKGKNANILRLGALKRIHPEIAKFSEFTLMKDVKTLKDLDEIYSKANIIGVTCLGSNHPLLVKRTFDVCIVDESTQVLQCSVLRPLFAAKKFILVGDPDQLPPIVRNTKARSLGMNECLFSRLDGTTATQSLNLQYRMNGSIMRLANLLTYKGQLESGNRSIENATIGTDVPKYCEKWIQSCISPNISDSVVVIDTGNTFKDHKMDSSVDTDNNCHNSCEAALVLHIIAALLKAGVDGEEIGVIAPYRDQVLLIQKSLGKSSKFSFQRVDSGISEDFMPSNIGNVEVNTVDQYQGRDKSVIIYSCTRTSDLKKSEKKSRENEILEDKRRLTVAITRAKHKLIIIGDVSTLKSYKPFETLFRELISEDDKEFRWNSHISLPKLDFKWENFINL